MRVVSILAGLAALFLVAPRGRADEPAKAVTLKSVKLDEALAFAREHHPRVAASRANVAAAKADAAIPDAQWTPFIGGAAELVVGTANNSTSTPVSTGVLDLPRIGGTKLDVGHPSASPYASTLLGLGVGQELLDFGRIRAQTAALEATVEVEKQRGALTSLDVSFGVEQAYFAVLAAKSVLVAAEGAVVRARAHRDQIKASVDTGLRTNAELARVEADLVRFEVARARAKGAVDATRADLAAAIGSPDNSIDAAAAPALDAALPSSLDAAIEAAGKRDPALLGAAARLREQEQRTTAIKAESRPNVWLTASANLRGGGATPSAGDPQKGSGLLPSVPNWDAGIVFSWRILDQVTTARADASRARENVRRAELDGVKREEAALVTRAFVAADVAKTALPGLERARAAAMTSYEQIDARWKQGLGTSVELADAEALRTDAEIQEALGRFEVARSRAALGRALGEDAWRAP